MHGALSYLLQDDDGQIIEGHSISAGLDYPGIGPEHAWLHDIGRAEYLSATDQEALDAFQLCSELEGIIPALEPAHALAIVTEWQEFRSPDFDLIRDSLKSKVIFDGRNLYDPQLVRSQGVQYFPIGR